MFSPDFCVSGRNAGPAPTERRLSADPLDSAPETRKSSISAESQDASPSANTSNLSILYRASGVTNGATPGRCRSYSRLVAPLEGSPRSGASVVSAASQSIASPPSQSVSGSTLSGGSGGLRNLRLTNRIPTRPDKGDAAWNTFLSSYQKGHWKKITDDAASAEAHSAAKEGAELAGASVPQRAVPSKGAKCSKQTRRVYTDDGKSVDSHAFFEANHYMAAPPLPPERRKLRNDILVSHGFTSPQERPSVARYARHARSVFRADFAAVTVACSDERNTLLLAKEGHVCSLSLSTLSSMCSHAMLLGQDEVLAVADIAKDWRFSEMASRHEEADHALRFFASAPILLSVAADGEHGANLISVGQLTIMRHEPWHDFSEEDATILLDIASMAQEALENEYLYDHAKKVRAMQREATALSYKLNRLSDTHSKAAHSRPRGNLGLLASPEQMQTLTDSLLKMVKPTCVSAFDVSGFRPVNKRSVLATQAQQPGQQSFGTNSLHAEDYELDFMAPPTLIASSGDKSEHPSISGMTQARDLCKFFSHISRQKLFAKPQWCTRASDDSSDDDDDDGPSAKDSDNKLESLFVAPYRVSCAISVFTNDRTRPVLLFLLSWRDVPAIDEADKLFCYTIGIIAAATTFREQAHIAESTQLDFIRSVQHELRTPLNGIMGITEFLRVNLINDDRTEKLDVGENSVLAHLLESLRLSGVNLSSALDDVLAFGSITGSGQQRDTGAASTINLIDEIMSVSKTELELITLQDRQNSALKAVGGAHSGVPTLIVNVDDVTASRAYRVDTERLRKILGKILSNALRFTKEAALVRFTVKPAQGIVQSRRQSSVSHVLLHVTDWVDFIIEDDGVGMSESFLSSSFNTAFSKENAFSQGLGLGVTIATNLIESLGGTLSVDSQTNEGTSVRISLPLERVSLSTEAQLATALPSIAEKTSQQSLTLQRAAFQGFESSGHAAVRDLLQEEFERIGITTEDSQEPPSVVVVQESDLTGQDGQLVYARSSEGVASLCPQGVDGKFVIVSRIIVPGSALRRCEGHPAYMVGPPFSRHSLKQLTQFLRGEQVSMPEPASLDTCPTLPLLDPSVTTVSSPIEQDLQAMSLGDSQDSKPAMHERSDSNHVRFNLRRNRSSYSTARFSDASSASLALTSESEAPPRDAIMPLSAVEDSSDVKASHKAIWRAEALAHDTSLDDTRSDTGPFRVLVVEDNPVNMKLITNVLSRAGLVYAEARDGREAVEQYKLFKPSIVLLDISLPIMDGFDACVEMRAHKMTHTPRIVAVTALSSAEDRNRGLETCGMDDWWTKPLNIRALRTDITSFKSDWDVAWKAPTSA